MILNINYQLINKLIAKIILFFPSNNFFIFNLFRIYKCNCIIIIIFTITIVCDGIIIITIATNIYQWNFFDVLARCDRVGAPFFSAPLDNCCSFTYGILNNIIFKWSQISRQTWEQYLKKSNVTQICKDNKVNLIIKNNFILL